MHNAVTLIGAGPIASIFAISLHHAGIKFTWYGNTSQHPKAMCYALHAKYITFLEGLSLLPKVHPIQKMQLCLQDDHFHLKSKYSDQPYLCAMIKHEELERLYTSKCFNLELAPKPYQNIHKLGDKVYIDQTTIHTSYIIAADGINSQVAKTLGIQRSVHDPDQFAHIALVTHYEEIDFAYQKFSPDGTFALLPIKPYQSNLVWCTDYKQHNSIQEDGLNYHLRSALKQVDLNLVESRYHQSLKITCHQSDTFYHKNTALIGTALHAIHPIAGLGLNLALGDLKCLIDLIINQQPLCLYQSQRTSAHAYANSLCHLAANSRHHQKLSKKALKLLHHCNNPLLQSYLIKMVDKIC
jgi:2-polyprenyl-6-methoxyphenol hydroxylase-like FAD-dependent oxidoreductase